MMSTLWRGLAPGLATGGALLTASGFWLYVTVGRTPVEGSFGLAAAGAAASAAVVAVALAQNVATPTHGEEFRARTLPWIAAVGCLVGVAVAWWRWPEATETAAVGPAWPAALIGCALAAVGFVLLALRIRVTPRHETPAGGASDPAQPGGASDPAQPGGASDPAQPGDASDPTPTGADGAPRAGGGGPGALLAVVVALAVPVATLAVLAPWVRSYGDDVRVAAAPLDASPAAGKPVQRWARSERRDVLALATVPVVWSDPGVEGLDPATGEPRWRVYHDDRRVTGVETWGDRVSVTWTVYPTVRNRDEQTVSTLIDAASGRVIAETDKAGFTFVGDKVVDLPYGCGGAGIPNSGLLFCDRQVRRIDADGRQLWTVDAAPHYIAYAGDDAVLLTTNNPGFVVVDPRGGQVLWRGDDKDLDDLVGVTDGVIVWRTSGRAGPIALSAVDVRTGAVRWQKDTGLESWATAAQARFAAAALGGHVDIIHTGERNRAAVTRLAAPTGAVVDTAVALDIKVSRTVVPKPSGTVLVLDAGFEDPQLIGIG